MTPTARIINAATSPTITSEDAEDFNEIKRNIPGWSTLGHVAFFKAALGELPCTARVLVCGVYHGMDLAIMERLIARHYNRGEMQIQLNGVDLFSAEPCADWPEEKRGMTWEQAFGCPPPDIEAARRNAPTAIVAAANSIEHLKEYAHTYDMIYLDTSHDEATVTAELVAIGRKEKRQLVAGDDYTAGQGGFDCGVARAVDYRLPLHMALFNRIWFQFI